MKYRLAFLFFFFTCLAASAQEMWGISNSNFAGVMGMSLNPATIVAAPYTMEINAISGDLFMQNNYVYLRKGNLETSDFYTTPDKKGYLAANLKGPSIIINRGFLTFAFHTALRAGFSAENVPFHFAKFTYDGFDFEPQHSINFKSGPFKVAGLTWLEAGRVVPTSLDFDSVLGPARSAR